MTFTKRLRDGIRRGADAAGMFPVAGRLEVGFPEGPSATLAGSGVINRAAARLTIEKDAVAVGKLLQALSHTNSTAVRVFKLIDAQARQSRKRRDFFVRNPDIAGRAAAAIAALRAGESEASVVPRQIRHKNQKSKEPKNQQ